MSETARLTPEVLDQLEALLEAATGGPWWADSQFQGDGSVVMGDGLRVAHAPLSDVVPLHAENTNLIAAAVNALPALIAAARESTPAPTEAQKAERVSIVNALTRLQQQAVDAPGPFQKVVDVEELDLLIATADCTHCPIGCVSCVGDDCECYTHQDQPDRRFTAPASEVAAPQAEARIKAEALREAIALWPGHTGVAPISIRWLQELADRIEADA